MGKRGPKSKFDGMLDEMIAFYELGYSVEKVANHFGCTDTTVFRLFANAGYETRTTKVKEISAIADDVFAFFRECQSIATTASHFGCSTGTIYAALEKAGIRVKGDDRPVPILHPMPPSKLDHLVGEMINFYEEGHTLEEVAVRFGCSDSSVWDLFRKNGYQTRDNPEERLDAISDEVLAYYADNHSLDETATHFGCSMKGVSNLFRKAGVEPRTRAEGNSLSWKQGVRSKTVVLKSTEPYRDAEIHVPPSAPIQAEFIFGGPYLDQKRKSAERRKEHYRANKEIYFSRMRKSYHELRGQTIEAYGGKCACCGEIERKFLAVDHIHGGGCQHHKELRRRSIVGAGFHRWLKNNNYPDVFRILCNNCNMASSLYGSCPHQTGPSTAPLYYHLKGRERKLGRQRFVNRRNREIIVLGYGGRCSCCDENRYEFLAIDHVNNDGSQHRAQMKAEGKNGQTLMAEIIKQGFPPRFRLQCHNCNTARGRYGACPHSPNT